MEKSQRRFPAENVKDGTRNIPMNLDIHQSTKVIITAVIQMMIQKGLGVIPLILWKGSSIATLPTAMTERKTLVGSRMMLNIKVH
jgi:hypothetical protein